MRDGASDGGALDRPSSSNAAAVQEDVGSQASGSTPEVQSAEVQGGPSVRYGASPTGSLPNQPPLAPQQQQQRPVLDVGAAANTRMRHAALAAAEYRAGGAARAGAVKAAAPLTGGGDGADVSCAEDSVVAAVPEVGMIGGELKQGAAEVVRASADVYIGRKNRGSDDADFLMLCPP